MGQGQVYESNSGGSEMKAQMVITHVQSGKRWAGEQQELTEDEFLDLKDVITSNITTMRYVESTDGDILPGDFIRNHCVLTIIQC
jgi:hypothetical protein